MTMFEAPRQENQNLRFEINLKGKGWWTTTPCVKTIGQRWSRRRRKLYELIRMQQVLIQDWGLHP